MFLYKKTYTLPPTNVSPVGRYLEDQSPLEELSGRCHGSGLHTCHTSKTTPAAKMPNNFSELIFAALLGIRQLGGGPNDVGQALRAEVQPPRCMTDIPAFGSENVLLWFPT